MHTPSNFTVLVVNSGSSSVKFTLFAIANEAVLARGVVERIGLEGTRITYRAQHGKHLDRPVTVGDAREAVTCIVECLTDEEYGVLHSRKAVAAVGHRVVHGGEKIHASVVIDEHVKKTIRAYTRLAPLHNPPNLAGIEACEESFPDSSQVAVFDTAFHATLPEKAYLYGLPYELYTHGKIRRYGFHGLSYEYIMGALRERAPLHAAGRVIVAHLGNGASMSGWLGYLNETQ